MDDCSPDIQEISNAVTEGIRIIVQSRYVAEQSMPSAGRYVFAYTVRIKNEGRLAAQLLGRHWIMTDGRGKVEEVSGSGVVGEQPILRPGEGFEYTSRTVLGTARGHMRGSYQMQRLRGRRFDAIIAPFLLALPHSLN